MSAAEKVVEQQPRKRPAPPGSHTLSNQLRSELKKILDRPNADSVHAMAKKVGVDHRVLDRFLKGQSGVTMATADRIGEAFCLKIVEATAAKPRRKPGNPS